MTFSHRATGEIREELRGVQEALRATDDSTLRRSLAKRRKTLHDELAVAETRLAVETGLAAVMEWAYGRCEAGAEAAAAAFRHLPPCGRRGRWMVDGTVLCGTCKRTVLGRSHRQESESLARGMDGNAP